MSDARAIYRTGFEHFVNGKRAEAIAEFRRALEVDPGLPIAWNGLSLALAQEGDLEGALAAAHELVELEPDDPLSHAQLSRVLQQMGRIPEAEDAMARANQLEQQRQSS